METRPVDLVWDGAGRDIVTLLLGHPTQHYGADVSEADDRVILYRQLDERQEATGEVVGVEIEDFLEFDHWDALPSVAALWQAPGKPALQLRDLLQQLQGELRAQALTSIAALSADPRQD